MPSRTRLGSASSAFEVSLLNAARRAKKTPSATQRTGLLDAHSRAVAPVANRVDSAVVQVEHFMRREDVAVSVMSALWPASVTEPGEAFPPHWFNLRLKVL